MSWLDIFRKHGMVYMFRKVYYRLDWRKPNAEPVEPLLVRNLEMARNHIKLGNIPTFTGTQDQIVLKCLKWVINNIKYVKDIDRFSTPEKWQTVDETLDFMTGDCEDGAMLIQSMCMVMGVNPGQFVLSTMITVNGGHCCCEYAPDEMWDYVKDQPVWYTIDWCYYPQIQSFKSRIARSDKYKNNWWELSVFPLSEG